MDKRKGINMDEYIRDKMLFGIDYKEARLIDKQRKEDEKNV